MRRQKVQDALERLKVLLKKNPGTVVRLHSHLNRQRGVRLLSDLLESEDTPINPIWS